MNEVHIKIELCFCQEGKFHKKRRQNVKTAVQE